MTPARFSIIGAIMQSELIFLLVALKLIKIIGLVLGQFILAKWLVWFTKETNFGHSDPLPRLLSCLPRFEYNIIPRQSTNQLDRTTVSNYIDLSGGKSVEFVSRQAEQSGQDDTNRKGKNDQGSFFCKGRLQTICLYYTRVFKSKHNRNNPCTALQLQGGVKFSDANFFPVVCVLYCS